MSGSISKDEWRSFDSDGHSDTMKCVACVMAGVAECEACRKIHHPEESGTDGDL